MQRRDFLKLTTISFSTSALLSMITCSQNQRKPNILWITCEDMSSTLGCYGDTFAYTPNIDKMASEGIRYNRAFASAPLCTPARSSIITGVYASSLGTQHLRGMMPLSPQIKGFPEFLREAGYYCTNNVKEDYNFDTPASFWDESSDTAHWRNRPKDKPFFSIFNLMTTHQSRTRYELEELQKVNNTLSEIERHEPDKVILPPYYPDTPRIRTNIAAFYTQVTQMDKEVGEILRQLGEDELTEDTIIFFYSDHGSGLPRGKRWLHESGIAVPLIIRFPEKYKKMAPVQPGSTEDRLVSFVDLPATALSLAGIRPPDYMQGQSFLTPYKSKPPEEIYAIRDRVDEVLEMSRTVHDGRYQYIRNFFPHRPRMQRSFYSELTPIRQEIRRLHHKRKLTKNEAWLMAVNKPTEELYDIENDPWEMNNLADQPQYANLLQQMRDKLYNWILKTHDLSLLHENDMIERAAGRMPYEIAANDSIYPIEHILEIAALVGYGVQHLDRVKIALGDNDPAVRYWAATGLAALKNKALSAKPELYNSLKDQKSWVRFAAAEACCYIGLEVEALQVLSEGLMLPNIKEILHAAQILVAIDEKSHPIIDKMKETIKKTEGMQDHGWYAREALTYLVEKLEKNHRTD